MNDMVFDKLVTTQPDLSEPCKGKLPRRRHAIHLNAGLPGIARELTCGAKPVALDGNNLTLRQIAGGSHQHSQISTSLDPLTAARMQRSYRAMMDDVEQGRPVYGCNTAYGGRAGRVTNQGDAAHRVEQAQQLSDALVFLDVGVGKPLPTAIVRAAMIIRVNMLLGGVSGIQLSQLQPLIQMLNCGITPVVAEHGGVGASGDLIHNQRVVSAARGLPGALATGPDGTIHEAADLLKQFNIEPLVLEPKAGLALVNGDNFSTAMAAHVAQQVAQCMLVSSVLSAMTIEALKGTNRSFHPLLADVRGHAGQKATADLYRHLLDGSQLAYQELAGAKLREPGVKVQDVYSMRCLAQFEGVMLEQLDACITTIEINANSASDNPLWVPDELATKDEEPWQWVSGGNFLAMHMAESLDSLRKITTQLIKKHDRHLARLIDTVDNNGLPANLSVEERSVTHCTFKGVQILSGMLEVQSMALSNPVTTLFGVHEERNQDITSHATTSGNLALRNLELLRYSLSGNLLAVTQAIDLRGGGHLLSEKTRPLYEFVRQHCAPVLEERALHGDLETLAQQLQEPQLIQRLLKGIESEPNGRCQHSHSDHRRCNKSSRVTEVQRSNEGSK